MYDDSTNNVNQPAFVDDQLSHFYDHYHLVINKTIEKIIKMYGTEKCLLIDMHGFTSQPEYGEYDLILGTGNRRTIKGSLDYDLKFAAYMERCGYRVFLPRESSAANYELYPGQFTVRHYSEKFGISAVQLEIASKFRRLDGTASGKKLARSISNFIDNIKSEI
jgi:N-formylglutamate amidohydrolase